MNKLTIYGKSTGDQHAIEECVYGIVCARISMNGSASDERDWKCMNEKGAVWGDWFQFIKFKFVSSLI